MIEELGFDLKDTQISQTWTSKDEPRFKRRNLQLLLTVQAIRMQLPDVSLRQIRRELEASTSEFDKEKLQERLAKLAGGVAVIKVGAATETEMKEMKLRIEDALAATKAAVEEGIVAGSSSYIDVIPTVAALLEKTEGDEKTGVWIKLLKHLKNRLGKSQRMQVLKAV